jgi:hypothetical protein
MIIYGHHEFNERTTVIITYTRHGDGRLFDLIFGRRPTVSQATGRERQTCVLHWRGSIFRCFGESFRYIPYSTSSASAAAIVAIFLFFFFFF